ncbi:hypothetical protein [Neorhizobium sp. DT-125]|uniref:hypothetical protein n=1 Tax=Neorhizobium sp. DT-125 TaxID=3396163 RepID=UPI003F1A56E3
MLRSEQIEVLALCRWMLRKQQVILENRILTDRLGPASPLNEFELGNPNIRLQIEIAARISRTERHRFDALVRLENMWQAHEDAERVDCDIDLSGKSLHAGRGRQHLSASPGICEKARAIAGRHASHRTFYAR